MSLNINDFIDRLEICCKSRGLKRTQFAHDFGIPESTIRNWIRNGNFPSVDIVYNMSKYFGVPMEYLINGSETSLDDQDFVMLLKFKKLSQENKKVVITVAESLIDQSE